MGRADGVMQAGSERAAERASPGAGARPRGEGGRPADASFAEQVHDALAHLHDPIRLQTHPLAAAAQAAVGPSGARSPAGALRRALSEAIEALRPTARPAADAAAERGHALLALRYVEGLPPAEVQRRLAVGRSLYFEEHRRALTALVSVLAERLGVADVGSGAVPPASAMPPNNLPLPLTSFIGREREIAAVKALLAEHRLITLTGAGGTGKTRLGLRVASELVGDFADGVFFVPLAPISDPEMVLPAVAQVLGLREVAGQSLRAALREYLRRSEALLLLDNLEQVLPSGPELTDLLAACPRVKMLVTSRQPLHLSGEHELAVPPLGLPEPGAAPSSPELLGCESVRLFVQRAQGVDPGFAIDEANAAAVSGVCQRLDGLPLAIELAAARTKLLSPPMLLGRLDRRLAVLTGGARDLPARQRTLRDTIAWSHDLLSEGEQRLFRRLAVFRGGCTLHAAEAVCGLEPDADVLDDLASLVDKSLVQRRDDPGGEARFSFLETVREYAVERLTERPDELAEVRRQHLVFYLGLAEQLEPELHRAAAPEHLDRLEREHDNLRAALEEALDAEPDLAVRLAGALGWFWHQHGHLAEGRGWLSAALADGGPAAPARLKALHRAGFLAHVQEDAPDARRLLGDALAMARALGDEGAEAWVLNVLGRVACVDGDLALARELAQRSLTMAEAGGDAWTIGWVLQLLARVETLEGRFPAAWAALERSLAIRRQLGDVEGVGLCLELMGHVAMDEGDDPRARALLVESLPPLTRVGIPWVTLIVVFALAAVEGALGRPATCARLAAAARRRHESIRSYLMTDTVAATERQLERARAALGAAEFEVAWTAGWSMSLDQAVEYALSAPEPEPRPATAGRSSPARTRSQRRSAGA
jgi:non-specific serine/threonine protein kinase